MISPFTAAYLCLLFACLFCKLPSQHPSKGIIEAWAQRRRIQDRNLVSGVHTRLDNPWVDRGKVGGYVPEQDVQVVLVGHW
ncbi:hypothetical protein F5Y17DRAFT_430366 [Xylariaceae sp. FL0594]|nr:hypothetical protein F5Y17DRAFT_430366 [Xylariaceae sp. FL0594]